MKKRVSAFLVLFLLLVNLFSLTALAEGSTSIIVSDLNPKAGNQFTVNISATEVGQIKISYDSRVIEIVGSSAQGESTSNSFTFNGNAATLTFRAKNEGRSGVIVESDTLSGSSVNIDVIGSGDGAQEAAPQEESAAQATPEAEATVETEPNDSTPVNAPLDDGSDFSVDGIGYVVSERYPDSEIPAGFVEVTLEINGKTVRELTNGVITIIYLKPTSNIEGGGEFYVYDEAVGSVNKMELFGSLDNYIITKTPTTFFTSKLIEADIPMGEEIYHGYYIEGSNSEFYYIYGYNPQAVEAWYAYDAVYGTFARADIMSLSMLDTIVAPVIEQPEPVVEEKSFFDGILDKLPISPKLLIIIAIGVLVLLLIVIIVSLIVRRKDDYDEYDDYDDDDEYDYEDEEEITPEEKTESLFGNKPGYNFNEGSKPGSEPADELIDDLIKKAAKEENMNIMDLDDL